MVQKECIIKGRDDAGARYKKGGMMQEDITKGRDGAEGHYKRVKESDGA